MTVKTERINLASNLCSFCVTSENKRKNSREPTNYLSRYQLALICCGYADQSAILQKKIHEVKRQTQTAFQAFQTLQNVFPFLRTLDLYVAERRPRTQSMAYMTRVV